MSIVLPVSIAEKIGPSLTWSGTPKTFFFSRRDHYSKMIQNELVLRSHSMGQFCLVFGMARHGDKGTNF